MNFCTGNMFSRRLFFFFLSCFLRDPEPGRDSGNQDSGLRDSRKQDLGNQAIQETMRFRKLKTPDSGNMIQEIESTHCRKPCDSGN